MSVKSANRNVNDLHKVAQEACRLFLAECERAGINIFITETQRSQARQNYLYEQGRTRPGNKITWTLNSNHKGGLAWDIAVSKPADLYDVVTLNKAGAIARKLGITWGGDWKSSIDRPHFEVKTTWKAPASNVSQDKPLTTQTPIKKEEIRMFNPTSKTLKDSVINLLDNAVHEKIIDGKWLKQAKQGKLKLDDLVALKVEIESRRKATAK
ncbi:M15 family metallopeptidase [Sporosarcina sp. FSL K6-5500]|uniref:M15 family metallopeptidase n=1 Tax=Sporosarcina sp. FSL K6-5500 TaxID=2921558 RepID=UPI0030F8BBF3